LGLAAVLLFASTVLAQSPEIDQELKSIVEVRLLLTEELAQYEQTLAVLLPEGKHPVDSSNPAVKNLTAETLRLRKRLITITEREVILIQQRIAIDQANVSSINSEEESTTLADTQSENQPLHNNPEEILLDDEAADVARLLDLLTQYHLDLQETLRDTPSAEELARRDAERQDAANLARIPFSADKIRLNGAEGITALARMTERLSNTDIPETRRDVPPIISIKTRLSGALTASENRSLRPVGKNQYIARINLQPGDTSVRILSHTWNFSLPENISAADYLITLLMPRSSTPELHVFAVDELLAQESPYIPAWLPNELDLKPRAG